MSRLYTSEILRLAASTGQWPRLAAPGATAEQRSPVCGSRIMVDVVLDADGHVTAYGHEVRACALGQASASVLASAIPGRTAAELGEATTALRAYLLSERDDPGAWPGLEIFAPAREHRARHAAILLPFKAAAEAALRA
ncbi:MAG: iron-sulfur cluster assembly scaffold protein [Sphingomonadaceae bacterium]